MSSERLKNSTYYPDSLLYRHMAGYNRYPFTGERKLNIATGGDNYDTPDEEEENDSDGIDWTKLINTGLNVAGTIFSQPSKPPASSNYYVPPAAIAPPLAKKNNTLLYVAIGGSALILIVTAVVIIKS